MSTICSWGHYRVCDSGACGNLPEYLAAPRLFGSRSSGQSFLGLAFYAAFRMGPPLATSRHTVAQRAQASAHLRIVSTCLCCPHSAAQASQISAQTLQSSWANCELDESKLAQTEHTGAHSWHKRIDPAILEGSLRPSSTQAEHQCRHWRHASIARSMSVLGAVLAMKISPFERHV